MSVRILTGDALTMLRTLESESVQCVITSPPYAFLRSYLPADHPDKAKEIGSEPTPEAFVTALVEVFREVRRVLRRDGIAIVNLGDSYSGSGKGPTTAASTLGSRGGKGVLPTDKIVRRTAELRQGFHSIVTPSDGLPPKNLLEIPSRVALALQADGWILRSRLPWIKRNPMPESTQDRPASAIEYLFLFARSPRYFWDAEAIRVPHARLWDENNGGTMSKPAYEAALNGLAPQGRNHRGPYPLPNPAGRSYRNSDPFFATWQGLMLDEAGDPLALVVNPQPSSLQHFASYPPALVEPFVKAGTSQRGCCPACKAPWVRMANHHYESIPGGSAMDKGNNRVKAGDLNSMAAGRRFENRAARVTQTTGWRPGCACYDDRYRAFPQARRSRKQLQHDATGSWWKRVKRRPGDPNWPANPCVVLDPFAGSFTTNLTAERLGRDSVGIELSEKYVELGRKRLYGDCPMFADIEVAG